MGQSAHFLLAVSVFVGDIWAVLLFFWAFHCIYLHNTSCQVRHPVKIEILAYILVILPILTLVIPMKTSPTSNSVSEYVAARITSTQSRLNNLSGDANRWHDRYVRSLFAVLFIGVWTLVCQFSATQRARMVSDAQSELLHLQDIKAANESRQLSEEAEALRSQNLAAKRQLVAAEEALEQERKTRFELQKSLAPRDFSAPDPGNVALFDAFMEKENAMKQFAGIEAAIEVIPDFEARRAAGIIEDKIKEAGWVVASNTLVDATPDGVTLLRHSGNLPKNPPALPAANELKSEQAANALAGFLEALGWRDVKLQTGSVAETGRLYVPPNKVVIQVGFKPNPFVNPEWGRKTRERYHEIRRKMPANQ